MSEFVPVKSINDWLWIGLGILFLIVYILVNEVDHWLPVTIPLELAIAIFPLVCRGFLFNHFCKFMAR